MINYRKYIINTGISAELSSWGFVKTKRQDVNRLFKNLSKKYINNNTLEIGFYVHGGLVHQRDAFEVSKSWLDKFDKINVLPVSIIWETSFWNTLFSRINNTLNNPGIRPSFSLVTPEGVESVAQNQLKGLWGNMKNKAERFATSKSNRVGGTIIVNELNKLLSANPSLKIKLHFVGHSAGAVLLTHFVDRLKKQLSERLRIASVTFIAPAVRYDLFSNKILPLVRNNQIEFYEQWYLEDAIERADPCGAYTGGSLLYLVSRGFEKGDNTSHPDRVRTEILGIYSQVSDLLNRYIKNDFRVQDFKSDGSSDVTRPMHGAIGSTPYVLDKIMNIILVRRKYDLE